MSKVKILIFTSALLASLSLALPAQACVVKSGKNCPSTVAHKVDHKVKLNKPGMVGGLGATTHTSPPEPLGAVPQQVVQTTPGAAHRPADFPIKPNLEYTFPTAHGQPHTYPSAVAQRNGAITNPDGSLTQHAIDLGFTVRAVNQSAPNMVPQPVATPNLQAPPQNPAMTQVPVPQTVQAPNMVPQPVATPNLQVPPQNPAMTQVAVPQAVQPPNLAQPPHAVVYNALHAEIRPHEQVYDLHDPAFHLVVVGFKEP